MSEAYKLIQEQQVNWARQQGKELDNRGYTLSLNDNLFAPLSQETRKEFEFGKGDELGESGSRGKMRALHSSSALVVNVFDYWRNRNVEAIAQACGAPCGMSEMRFERTHSTPLGGIPPHLDVEFYGGANLEPLAIEAKFTEPYHRKTKRAIRDRYLTYRGLWARLPRCEKLVERIREEERIKTSFTHLDAPQLLKHILGLSTQFPRGFQLLYLWYDLPSPEADRHRLEISDFVEQVGNEIDFRVMTYQELFNAIKILKADRSYQSYLAERYFSPTQESYA